MSLNLADSVLRVGIEVLDGELAARKATSTRLSRISTARCATKTR
jgi:hypothetical protein